VLWIPWCLLTVQGGHLLCGVVEHSVGQEFSRANTIVETNIASQDCAGHDIHEKLISPVFSVLRQLS
jgi:hypothetical protein